MKVEQTILDKMEEGGCGFKMLTAKLTGNRPLRRPRHRWGTVLEWILKEYMSVRVTWLIRLRIGII